MNLNRLQFLNSFDHLMCFEVEHDDGYRMWLDARESELDEAIKDECTYGWGLSDIDHHAKCECLASWDEWLFLLDIQRMMA